MLWAIFLVWERPNSFSDGSGSFKGSQPPSWSMLGLGISRGRGWLALVLPLATSLLGT